MGRDFTHYFDDDGNPWPRATDIVEGTAPRPYWFDRLAEANVFDVLINTHHLRDEVRQYVDEVNEGGRFRLSETYEPTLLGSAGTIHANRRS